MFKRIFIFYLVLTSSLAAQEQITITMGNVFGDPQQGAMPTHTPRVQELISQKISEYTNGQIKWVILPGKRPDGINMFRSPSMVAENDQIQATSVPAFFLPRVPEVMIQSIPFLFEGAEHSRRFMGSAPANWLSEKIEEAYGVKVLGHLYNAAYVSINSTTPVREPEDFAGKIINGFDKTWDPMWDNIKPKERRFIGFNEAMTGILVAPESDFDVNIGMLQNNHGQQLHKRFTHTTLVPNFYNIFYTMMINRDVWNGLSDFQREGILRAFKEGQAASIAYQTDTTFWAIQRNQAEGVIFHILTDTEQVRWKSEFHDKIRNSVIANSENPNKTSDMIKKIEALVDDLRWR